MFVYVLTLLDVCVSSLRRGHANLLCIVPILTDDPRRKSSLFMCCFVVFLRRPGGDHAVEVVHGADGLALGLRQQVLRGMQMGSLALKLLMHLNSTSAKHDPFCTDPLYIPWIYMSDPFIFPLYADPFYICP